VLPSRVLPRGVFHRDAVSDKKKGIVEIVK